MTSQCFISTLPLRPAPCIFVLALKTFVGLQSPPINVIPPKLPLAAPFLTWALSRFLLDFFLACDFFAVFFLFFGSFWWVSCFFDDKDDFLIWSLAASMRRVPIPAVGSTTTSPGSIFAKSPIAQAVVGLSPGNVRLLPFIASKPPCSRNSGSPARSSRSFAWTYISTPSYVAKSKGGGSGFHPSRSLRASPIALPASRPFKPTCL
mmetsp:Transcript_8104/g.12602  ORF Transcript_8104/g.12602 Transcript_8104/m.12602 type:complete len:206 (-) Transcript_8104:868-1485(-)